MPMIRTSRTNLFDRWVRVDRRQRQGDGSFGTVPRYVTIIDRFWVTIFPPQHQPRSRMDLGEVPDLQHVAIGDPSRNGRTIMVMDRFVDVKNNMTYQVEGVERPHGTPLNALHRFTLRLIQDVPSQS